MECDSCIRAGAAGAAELHVEMIGRTYKGSDPITKLLRAVNDSVMGADPWEWPLGEGG